MVNPNNPIIDTRSTVVGGQQPFTAGGTTPPATTPTTTPTTTSTGSSTGSSSSTPTTGSQVQLSSTVPTDFKGSTNQDVIDYLEKKIAQHKPLSKEELEKLRRKQKIEGIISGVSDAAQAISNLMFSNQYAPNMYNAKEGMSAKAKERFDKEKAEREAEDERYFNYAMQVANLKGADKDRGLRIWQTEQALGREDRAYEANRKDRANDEAFRKMDYDTRVAQWQAGFDRDERWHQEEAERWERQFQESIRQFNVSTSLERQRIGIQAQQLVWQIKQGQFTFNLGNGNGNVTVPTSSLNSQTISRIYSTLPENVRANVQGEAIVQNGMVIGYQPPSTEAMLIAIGAYVEDSPATQNAIRQVAGIGTGNAGGNTMPGVK